MPCPLCEEGMVERLPACAKCWTQVPMAAKRQLGRHQFNSPEYRSDLAVVLDAMARRDQEQAG